MGRGFTKVLVVGGSSKLFSGLMRCLENHGCHLWYAKSTEDALTLMDEHDFRLVLSTRPLKPNSEILEKIGSSDCSVFYCFPVETSCWWLPAVARGKKCLGAPALRPSEFVNAIEEMMKGIAAAATA